MESSTSSFAYDPYSDSFQPEYGVPEYEPVTEQETTEQSATTTETTESDEYMPEYNPLDEEPQDVYGPPPDLD